MHLWSKKIPTTSRHKYLEILISVHLGASPASRVANFLPCVIVKDDLGPILHHLKMLHTDPLLLGGVDRIHLGMVGNFFGIEFHPYYELTSVLPNHKGQDPRLTWVGLKLLFVKNFMPEYQKVCERMNLVKMRYTEFFKILYAGFNAQMNATPTMDEFAKTSF